MNSAGIVILTLFAIILSCLSVYTIVKHYEQAHDNTHDHEHDNSRDKHLKHVVTHER